MESLLRLLLNADENTLAVIASGGNVGPQPGSTITRVLNDIMAAHTSKVRHRGKFYNNGISPDVLLPCMQILTTLCNSNNTNAFSKAKALLLAHQLGYPYNCELKPLDAIQHKQLAPGLLDLPRGVIYFIGSRGRRKPFTNPARARTITVSWSGAHNANSSLSCDRLVDLSGGSECFTSNKPGGWIECDLGEDRRVAVTGYALRHGTRRNHWHMRNWVLEGTNHMPEMKERRRWVLLSQHRNDTTLNGGDYPVAYWKIDRYLASQEYRTFRIRQTGSNAHGATSHAMYISGFELYGTLLRRFNSGNENDTANTYYKGLVVEARYCGRPKWSTGIIDKEHLDGTFDIRYIDGELNRIEKNVQRAVIRYPQRVKVGTFVERRRWNKGTWLRAKVTGISVDGTFNLVFDDRSRDEKVERATLRLPDIFWRNQVIEVLAQGYWCLATIKDQHRDGTYDVIYAGDHEKECNVARSRMRHQRDVAVGTKILARYRGTGGWFNGQVTSVSEEEDPNEENGAVIQLYCILYDDGAEEKNACRGVIKVSEQVDHEMRQAEAQAAAKAAEKAARQAKLEAKTKAEAEDAARVEAELAMLLGTKKDKNEH